MKKLLVVLASVLLIAGTASAGIGVGGGWNSALGLSAQVEFGLGPVSIQGNVGFMPLSFGGDVIFRFASLLDGKLTPYAGGGAYYVPDVLAGLGWGTAVPAVMFGGKGGVEYKVMDNLVVYGGYGYYLGMVIVTGWTLPFGGGGFDAGARFMIGQ